jgi:cytochrome P450
MPEPDDAAQPPIPGSPRPRTDPDFLEDPSIDPHPQYARLRAECPVPRFVRATGVKHYVVTRYEDAKATLIDPRLSKDKRYNDRAMAEAGLPPMDMETTALHRTMLSSDPPDHTRLRRLVAAEFTGHRTEALRPRVQEIADELISGFEAKGEAELIAQFANPLPALVIAELLGVPREDQAYFRSVTNDFMRPWGDPVQVQAQVALADYLLRQIREKRAHPGDDLLSSLISSREADRLDEDELRGTALLLLVAGHETTANLIGNGMFALLRRPDQYKLVCERPELIPGAVEEFLRFAGPIDRAPDRYALEDMEIAGTLIPEGSIVLVGVASANRDDGVFDDPDTLDVTRNPRGHLAFGHGIHFCLGAPLARIEAQVAFATLLSRLPDLELAVPVEAVTYRPADILRALVNLPVRFTPRV